jgi:RNA polymerase sigma factor (sigma-70 family)
MDEHQGLAERFERQRPRLRAVAYRMLGSRSEAEDAVQEAWLRLEGAAHGEVDDLGAWLTTVVARISLNMLRARKTRGEAQGPEPRIDGADGSDESSPEDGALLADAIGLALLVVLETLAPAERVAFVLHDIFGMPFEQVASIVERTPEAARQLASRARRRVQTRKVTGKATPAVAPDVPPDVQRSVVHAFVAAAQDGDFQRLVALLDPAVVLRSDGGPGSDKTIEVHGAEQVARRAQSFSRLGLVRVPALINGAHGLLSLLDGKPFSVMAFTVRGATTDGRGAVAVTEAAIAEIDIVSDPERLAELDLSALAG